MESGQKMILKKNRRAIVVALWAGLSIILPIAESSAEKASSMKKTGTAAMKKHEPEALAWLKKWVDINSFTLNVAGVNEVGKSTAEAFAQLGFQAKFVPSKKPVAGNHLILIKRGEGKAGGKSVAFVSHLDTVYSPEEEKRLGFAWKREGDRIYGPGVIDCKGGTALVWLMLKTLSEAEPDLYRRFTFYFFINATEEGFHHHFAEVVTPYLASRIEACLVVEPETLQAQGFQGSFRVVTARKGGGRFVIESMGQGGHAGNAHASGVNAIRQLARAVEAAESLTDPSREVTVNVGMFSGGVAPNRIPESAQASGDVRAFSQPHLTQTVEALKKIAKLPPLKSGDGKKSSTLRVKIADIMPPMSDNEATSKLFEVWERAGKESGARVEKLRRGGMSDANMLFDQVPTLDGLGPLGDNMHCSVHDPASGKEAEFLFLPAFLSKAQLNNRALLEILTAPPILSTGNK